ncbi:MAG: ABC transporter ATP-binding protein [Spirochaetes bacterium]|nr:ABC transporter ATP-binding protein [Spirochaetota bacterium]
MSKLEIVNCSKSFGKKKVIDNVSFSVEEGDFCILLGPSGCGKSTLLRLIAGLEAPDSGEIRVDGRDVTGLGPRDRDAAMVFQSYALYPHMSVRENLSFPLRMRKTPAPEINRKVMDTAALLGIDDLLDRRPGQLSGGQRQRVAMGRAIVRNPSFFLFDEPLSNLDARLRASMRVELARLHRELGVTTVYVTHDQTEAMTLGRTLVLIDCGSVQQSGTPRDVYELPANIFAASFLGSPAINLIPGTLEPVSDGIEFTASGVRVAVPDADRLKGMAGKEVTAGIRPEALAPGNGSLNIDGLIEHQEHTGSEVFLYIRTGDSLITARAPADFSGLTGAGIRLAFRPEAMHLFYEGRRI